MIEVRISFNLIIRNLDVKCNLSQILRTRPRRVSGKKFPVKNLEFCEIDEARRSIVWEEI